MEPEEANQSFEGIAFHTACAIVHPERDHYDLYKLPDFNPIHKSYIIKEEGVYVFGGKNEEGKARGDLKILKIGKMYYHTFDL